MCYDLEEWWHCIEKYPERKALEWAVLAAVREGAPEIPAFPRRVKSGAPCANADFGGGEGVVEGC